MSTLTRHQIASIIRDKLLSGRKLTATQFDKLLQKHGNHERSRVLELLRCQWGLPVKEDRKKCYHLSEDDLRRYHDDPEDVVSYWKKNANEDREYRELIRFMKTFSKMTGDISPMAKREVLAAVTARI